MKINVDKMLEDVGFKKEEIKEKKIFKIKLRTRQERWRHKEVWDERRL